MTARSATTATLGVVLALSAWSMIFASLLLACGFLRGRSGAAFGPTSEALVRAGALRICGALFLAGTLLLSSRRLLHRARLRPVGGLLLGATLSATVGLCLQIELLFQLAPALPARSSAFASALFGLLGFHAAHLAVAILGLAALTVGAFRRRYSVGHELPLRLWAMGFSVLVAAWGLSLPLWSSWAIGGRR